MLTRFAHLSQPWRIFILLLLTDFLLLYLHVLFAQSGSLFFHLDYENNLPTTYQSFKLILFGGFFIYQLLHHKITGSSLSFLLPLSLFMIVLGLDELLQLHENVYRLFELTDLFSPTKVVDASLAIGYRSSLWILYYLPIFFLFFFWIGYWFRYFQVKIRVNSYLLMLTNSTLLIVLAIEIISSTGEYSHHAYFWLTTIEEVAEMLFASTLTAIGLLTVAKQPKPVRN